jgi:hypothetical protein
VPLPANLGVVPLDVVLLSLPCSGRRTIVRDNRGGRGVSSLLAPGRVVRKLVLGPAPLSSESQKRRRTRLLLI